MFNPKRELEKYGWTTGNGLGRNEDGIKTPLKVKLKNDKTGVGHHLSEEFTCHWWNKLYDDAASNICVLNSQANSQTYVEFKVETERKAAKKLDGKELLYGLFIKSTEHSVETVNIAESDGVDNCLHERNPLTLHKIIKSSRGSRKINGKLLRIMKQEMSNLI